MEKEPDTLLLIDEDDVPIIFEEECAAAKPIIKNFIECYAANKDKPVTEWLGKKLQENLPKKSPKEIQEMTDEIITTIQLDEDNKASLDKAVANGRSKESWFASETKKATSAMSAQQASNYLSNLDKAIKNANESLYRTITTQAGTVNQNPHLDGYIAEQYHAQTFNLNAEATGSQYRAKVLEPKGNGYAKNSVDLEIVDKNGKVVSRYQSKYCKDSKATNQAFEHGDYRGQQKIVPKEQQAEIKKKSTDVLEAPDGTKSTPLSKSKAEKIRDKAQKGKLKEFDWNEYKTKDLALGIGKQIGQAAIQGAVINTGFEFAQKLCTGEEIKGEEVVKTAILSAADSGLKAAVGGALKVGVEKGIITSIPKGTPAGTLANIAFVGIEDVKVIGKIATGECSFKEGINKIEQTTVATVAGIAASTKGAAIGAAIGATIGPIGVAIGGFIGGTVGYMAGSKFGETCMKGVQEIEECAHKVMKDIGSGIKTFFSDCVSGVESFCSGVESFCSGVCSGVASLFGL